MRLSSFLLAMVMTVTLLIACPQAQAKHRYFANLHPLGNYLNRCLGVGWSDGYHAPGGWNKPCWPHEHWQLNRGHQPSWVHPAFAPPAAARHRAAHFQLPQAPTTTHAFGWPPAQR
jgi:hypothetical protein